MALGLGIVGELPLQSLDTPVKVLAASGAFHSVGGWVSD